MKSSLFTALAVTLFATAMLPATSACAASAIFELKLNPAVPGCSVCTLSGPNTWNLFASVSHGDNFGLAAYGISVQNVTSTFHRAPRVVHSEDLNFDIYSAGFSILRSANNGIISGTGFYITASQDTVAPTPYLIRGFGQSASSFAAHLPPENTNIGVTQPTWDSKLLLAEGSYAAGAAPYIDLSNIDSLVNVFNSAQGTETSRASWTAVVTPEPSSAILLMLGGTYLLPGRKRICA
jgi:hypothetical protein